MGSGTPGLRTCADCLRALPTETFTFYAGGKYRRRTCAECTARRARQAKYTTPESIVRQSFPAEPPAAYRIRKRARHKYGAEETLVTGERERECLTCGALLRTRPDGRQYGSALELTCEESQRLNGYTPEYQSGEAERVQANLNYLVHCHRPHG